MMNKMMDTKLSAEELAMINGGGNLFMKHYFQEKIDERKIEKGNVGIPKFTKDMDCVIGDANLYIIIGDVFLINKEFDISIAIQLFDSKGYYSNLIIRNNVNSELMKN